MPVRRPPRPGFLRPPIGRRLAELRLAKGFTQEDVALALHVATTFVCRVETGVKPWPTARRGAWAKLLGTTPAELESLR